MDPSDSAKLREEIDAGERRFQETKKQLEQKREADRVARKEAERIAREKAQQQKLAHLAATREKHRKLPI